MFSPLTPAPLEMTLIEALQSIRQGHQVSSLAWSTEPRTYGLLVNDRLSLIGPLDGQLNVCRDWILTTADFEATDWFVRS